VARRPPCCLITVARRRPTRRPTHRRSRKCPTVSRTHARCTYTFLTFSAPNATRNTSARAATQTQRGDIQLNKTDMTHRITSLLLTGISLIQEVTPCWKSVHRISRISAGYQSYNISISRENKPNFYEIFFFLTESPWPQLMSESSELYVERGWDRIGEGCISKYLTDFSRILKDISWYTYILTTYQWPVAREQKTWKSLKTAIFRPNPTSAYQSDISRISRPFVHRISGVVTPCANYCSC